MKDDRIIVIGGSGYLGRHFIEKSLKGGSHVLNLDRQELDLSHNRLISQKFDLVTDVERIKMTIAEFEPNSVVMFAAISSVDTPLDLLDDVISVNIGGLAAVIQNLNRDIFFCFVSSVYAAYNGGGLYSISKRFGEELVDYYCTAKGIRYAIHRYGTIYGPSPGQGNSILEYIMQAQSDGKIKYYGTGKERRELIHINDASTIAYDLVKGQKEGIYAVSGSESFLMSEIFQLIFESLNQSVNIEYCNTKGNHYYSTSYNHWTNPAKKVSGTMIDLKSGLFACMKSITIKH